MESNNEEKRVLVFLNKNLSISCSTTIQPHMSINDLIVDCKEKLNINNHSKCILYDTNGAELSDDDIEYMNSEEPLFLSLGEKFSKISSLALYTEIKKLGQGGFGSVHLYEHKYNHSKVAIKSIKLNSLMSPEDINRVYTEIAVLRELKQVIND